MCVHHPHDSLLCLSLPASSKEEIVHREEEGRDLSPRPQKSERPAGCRWESAAARPPARRRQGTASLHFSQKLELCCHNSKKTRRFLTFKIFCWLWLHDFDQSQVDVEKRREEQREFGVFFDDDYDYLQHLKEASGTTELVASGPSRADRQRVHLHDGDEESEEEGDTVRPVSSPAVMKILEVWLRRFYTKCVGKEVKGPTETVCCVVGASMWSFKDHFTFLRVNNTEMLSHRINHRNLKYGRLFIS